MPMSGKTTLKPDIKVSKLFQDKDYWMMVAYRIRYDTLCNNGIRTNRCVSC